MEKYPLTPEQIESILENIKIESNNGIPLETATSVTEYHKSNLRKQLKSIVTYPRLIPQIKKEIETYFFSSLIQPGECVGILSAQSIGEKNTQCTLDTFHQAGKSEKMMTTGVPRFQELMNTTKPEKQKNISCTLYFKGQPTSLKELKYSLGNSIVNAQLKQLIYTYEIKKVDGYPRWYKPFCLLHDITIPETCDWVISIKLDKGSLYNYHVTAKDIADKLYSEYTNITIIYSPLVYGQIDILFDSTLILKQFKSSHCLEDIFEEFREINVCGIEGIKDIFFLKKDGEWIAETQGSNIRKLLAHPEVVSEKFYSNNVWEIFDVFGIEAARQFLINEYLSVIDGINECHVKLLVEKMTMSGSISSISRYTSRASNDSEILSHASFEESLQQFLTASYTGDVDKIKGVSASIIVGRKPPIGTGMFGLRIDIEKLNLM
jgi:DNA-directed RNA polymerase beta' subunit